MTLRVWHVDDTLVAFAPADVGEPDTRVTGRALDDGPARSDETFLLGVLDEVEGRPVLDRSSGGHELGLGEDVAPSLLGQLVQSDLGCEYGA